LHFEPRKAHKNKRTTEYYKKLGHPQKLCLRVLWGRNTIFT